MITNKSGQSIIEVVIATTLISIGIIAALSLTNRSQRQVTYSKTLDQANAFNNQLADYLRDQKSRLGWAAFVEKVEIDNGSSSIATYCYSSIPASDSDFSDKSAGVCSSSSYITGTNFVRSVEIDTSRTSSGIIDIDITTTWQESTPRSAQLHLELTQWR